MQQHPIEGLMSETMEQLKHLIDVKTIIGDSIQTADGSTIIPISKVSFGFVAGGSGGGVSITPIAFTYTIN